MKRATITGGAFAIILVLLALAAQDLESAAATSPAMIPSTAEAHEGLLFGRVGTDDGAVYEGQLRWGGNQEAVWGNYFNGFKDENPWAIHAPAERLTQKRPPMTIFGFEIPLGERQVDLGRPFMARFGDLARIEARGRDVRVTLKSGTVFDIDWGAANDLDDGVRVWDGRRDVVNLASWAGGLPPPARVRIRTIEFLPSAPLGAGPYPLHGTVRTRQGDFTGLVQWDRQECVGSDELGGRSADGELNLRFDTIRSIARRSRDSSLVRLLDGREMVLSSTRKVGDGNSGIYVDDQRYGRVLISWDAFERVDFSPGGTGPAYGDFSPGRPLMGSVTTRSGRRLAGRLVYDLDESETTETLDARLEGVDYTIPLGLVASIALPGLEERGTRRARVTLRSGETLQLELTGDLGEWNAGMLVFDGRQRPEYVPWADVAQVDFDRPPEMSLPSNHR